jgi:small subunit ribosomal protein S5
MRKANNEESGIRRDKGFDMTSWKPKTEIGKKVKAGEITHIDEILDNGLSILEPEIIDALLPDLESDLIEIGQSKGKFGGGKRSIWKQTQKKSKEGNKPSFSTMVVAGNKDGYIGVGSGKAKETVPAREKALRKAKLNIIKVKRGCGSWACGCGEPHTIPFQIEGKSGSVRIKIMPAPKGTGLTAEKECRKLLMLAGIKDVYSKTKGQSGTKINLIKACFAALKQLSKMKVRPEYIKKAGITEGRNE